MDIKNQFPTVTDVKEFWERNLCMDLYLKSKYLSPEYFEESTSLRYKYHYHISQSIRKLDNLKHKLKVLEIGLGVGCDTQLLCEYGFDVTAIDLTEKSIKTTIARLEHYKLKAKVEQGNAEELHFQDNSFDAVYSFGVLHHTPNTQKSIDEVHRVLKYDGIALIMLYNKRSLNYLVHKITNIQFDGTKDNYCPVERTYNKNEIKKMFSKFKKVEIDVDYLFGTGYGVVNKFLPLFIKKKLAKFFGWHLMIWAFK